jgi:16S rRNA processing protein RimM
MGRIVAPYGVKGWLKVVPSTAEHDTLLSYKEWWLRPRGEGSPWRRCVFAEGRPHGSSLVARVEELGDREAAAAYAGGEVGVARSALPPAGEGQVYWADLVGLAVFNRDGEELGKVTAVQDFGAHPVMVVAHDEGQRLIPYVEAWVDAVDVAGGRIEVDWQKDYS